MLYKIIRFFLFRLNPETAHRVAFKGLKLSPAFIFASKKIPSKPNHVMGITFPNPVGLAAGLDKSGDYIKQLAKLGFGFIEIGTITPKPQSGNSKPRLFRLPKAEAIINRMGFNNQGVNYLIKKIKQSGYKGVLGINIGKNAATPIENAIDDYLTCLKNVYPYASYIVINISSPNTVGLRDLQYGDYLENLLNELKKEQAKQNQRFDKYVPLVLKISPDLTPEEVISIGKALLKYKIDGVIATNTTLSRNGVEELKFANEQGGLSGKPLTKASTHIVQQLSNVLEGKLPIIASGGIMTAEDAAEKIAAGASLVQIYTGFIYHGPALIKEIIQAIS